jgi:hypothetical protein
MAEFSVCPLSATSRHLAAYSITSSARSCAPTAGKPVGPDRLESLSSAAVGGRDSRECPRQQSAAGAQDECGGDALIDAHPAGDEIRDFAQRFVGGDVGLREKLAAGVISLR